MQELILSHSPDAFIQEVHRINDIGVMAWARVIFEHQEHLDYLTDAYSRGTLKFDLRSRIARLGFDCTFENGAIKIDVEPSKKAISFLISLYPWSQDYFPNDDNWQNLLAYRGFRVGKLVNLTPEMVVHQDEL